MKYISTRGAAPSLPFDEVLLAGLARDGGLYVPETWPSFAADDWRALRGRDFAAIVAATLRPFVAGTIADADLDRLCREAYAGFRHPAVAPLTQIGSDHWLLELFHGPTIAFKDYALQLLGRLFDHVLTRRGRRMAILGATSGDTGSAAIEGCRACDAVDVFILYPHGRVSDVQRRQMTTVAAANVHAIAVDGSFDDCQDIVKALFGDLAFRDRWNLGAINSINWARIVAQSAYYVAAGVALGAPERPVAFGVPTGNFGNVLSAWVARRMGLPIERLIVGTNQNDVLYRFFTTGTMTLAPVAPSLSPSMDIQVSSNFERLLFELFDRDGPALAREMTAFRATGRFTLAADRLARTTPLFAAGRADDARTTAVITDLHRRAGIVVDPHTAVGLAAAADQPPLAGVPLVSLACAHPAKFPDAVRSATGLTPALPTHLADLLDRPERGPRLANDKDAVARYLAAHARVEA
jgi:threonine synthase